MSRRSIALPFALVAMGWAVPAAAHINMTYPPARYVMDQLKDPPCGAIGNPPGVNPPTVLQAGETITITLNEFVDHGGHFRISFSEDGTDQFVSPTAFDDFYPDPSVLMDNIPDNQVGGIHEIDFEVPNVNCNPCTIQALQVMSGGTFSEDSLYYQCADIVIEGAVAGGTGSEGSNGGTATDATATATDGDASSGDDDGGTTAAVDDNGAEDSADTAASGDDGTQGPVTASDTTDGDQDDDGSRGCSCTTATRTDAPWVIAGTSLLVLGWRRRRSC